MEEGNWFVPRLPSLVDGGPAAPVSILAGSERGVAISNFWRARVRSSGEERPVRAARSPLANRLPVSTSFFPPREELGL
jgi:hypothetical protein